jgi:hypothetical protein
LLYVNKEFILFKSPARAGLFFYSIAHLSLLLHLVNNALIKRSK